ncbi:MAG: purine-nucleoside phosphorylase [Bacilli bacterium]|nr:purine-nucleoside phosphorylase [Bacilli bacterium]
MTPHIEALKEDIAKTVIMPGDPLRAKFIAETYLDNYKLVNKVRNIYAYTGFYKNKKVTIMASGMGMPSMGIYSYELFKFYEVDNIIRVGSCGAYTSDLKLYDVILVDKAYSDSSYAFVQNNQKESEITSSTYLNQKIKTVVQAKNVDIKTGTIYSSDVFYKEKENYVELHEKHHCLGVEMESFALFHNAKILNKQASCLLTVSDNLVTKEETTSLERQTAFTKMIEIALESIL